MINFKNRRKAVNNAYGLFVGNSSLYKLIIDPIYRYVHCNDNFLTELKCNDNLLELDCSYNELKTLELNDRLKACWCNNNQLKSITCNEDLTELYCVNNQLTFIKCNKKLKILYCTYNKLTELELNDGLEELYCNGVLTYFLSLGWICNKITSIKYIPSSLRVIECYGHIFDFDTKLRLVKHCVNTGCIINNFLEEIKIYKKYLVLLLQLNTYIIKYL